MVVGSILLAIVSLDLLYTMVVAIKFGADELAKYAVYAAYVGETLNYIGLLLVGAGLFGLSKNLTVADTDRAESHGL